MKNKFIKYWVFILMFGCNKDITVDEVLSNLKFDKEEILADGQSTVSISVELSDKSNPDRRNIIFTTTGGVFADSSSKKITAKAEFQNGVLIAKATLRVPIKPANIVISAKLEFNSPLREYIVSDSILAKASVPSVIELEPSATGIASNFISEINFIGTLQNASGGFVSAENKVIFQDFLLSGNNANGIFRNIKNSSNDSSVVSGNYSANSYPIGTTIKILSTVLDSFGNETNIKDSFLLKINQ